ncbi:hypothetical protein ACFWPH_32885 [Nocardia sp. NPDC058499]|uniref:hypothetical protein n=1 Tax=Nocardia sp. NPDC058499 TaxID=3346530 RepID=UPI0036580317
MTGDPVEESGQAIRTGFIQSMQTAAMMSNLLQRRGGEARSRTEFDQRLQHAEAKEHRSLVEHQLRWHTSVDKARDEHALNQARLIEVQDRNSRAEDLFDLEVRFKNAQYQRGETNQHSREETDRVQRDQSRELHEARMDGYRRRETHDTTLHNLEVEYKKLLIDIRRRAAGFTDSLTAAGDTGSAAASAAGFAAATGAAGLSDLHAGHVHAYQRRFAEDTGLDPSDLPNGTGVSEGVVMDAEPDDLDITDVEMAGVDTGPVGAGRVVGDVGLDDVFALTEELTAATYLEHLAADLDSASLTGESTSIDDALDAAGLSDLSAEDLEFDSGPEPPVRPGTAPVPDVGPEP